jgi:hypothetical protein
MNLFPPLQVMSHYDQHPQLWHPDVMPSLFLVKLPASIGNLDEQTYKVLMQQRMSWMIQKWMEDHSQLETQRLLATRISELHSYQEFPIIDQDENEDEAAALIRWREAWGETLIFYNETFSQAIALLCLNFTIPILNEDHPEFSDFLELHQETNLEEWLNDLSAYT